jgi:hypothetical protein
MNITIQLNNQLHFRTAKVNNITADWMLAAKLVTTQLPTTQSLPQRLFRLRRFTAHAAGMMQNRW